MPPTKPVLKLNGKPFSLVRESARVVAIRAVLDKLPADEIFTGDELESKYGLKGVRDCGKLVSEIYSHRVGPFRYWGNPAAIKALIAQVGR